MGGISTTGASQQNIQESNSPNAQQVKNETKDTKKGGANIVTLTHNLRDMQSMFKALNTQIKKQKDEIDTVKTGLKPTDSCPYCLRVDFGQTE
jgi:septal ring factor EnvC (AmiA/AmiB activator)